MMNNSAAAKLAKALGDPLRLAILHRLMEGPAAVADLVSTTGENQPKVSNHLAVLRERGLVVTKRRGRQTVYQLRDPSVAQLVETLSVISGAPLRLRHRQAPISLARTCYDHLAGKLGVALFDALVRLGVILPTDQIKGDLAIGPASAELLMRLGADIESAARTRRRFAYACLDWTERRPHLGGWLGASICDRFLEAGWVVKDSQSRAVFLTPAGRRALKRHLGLAV